MNEVVTQAADPALIKNLQQQLLETKKALDEMAKRNSHAEKASEESSAEVQKLKDMIFGEGDVSEFEVGLRSPKGVVPQSDKNATIRAPKPRKLFSTEPKIPTIYESKKETNSRSMDAETLSRDSAAPMREVLIMNAAAPISTKPRHLQSLDELSQNYASDLENRARFLEDRVEVTEDLVETLKQDLVKARSCVHKLVYNNAKLGGKCTKLTNKVSKLENHGRNEFRQQYMLLKYTMYASLFFFLFGMHEAFLSLAFFLWLSLESYTALEP